MVASSKVAQAPRLPRRFPVGTKLIVEDRGTGGVHSYARYLVFPDGRRIDVPTAALAQGVEPLRRRRKLRR
jgi:hypothetical protein